MSKLKFVEVDIIFVANDKNIAGPSNPGSDATHFRTAANRYSFAVDRELVQALILVLIHFGKIGNNIFYHVTFGNALLLRTTLLWCVDRDGLIIADNTTAGVYA